MASTTNSSFSLFMRCRASKLLYRIRQLDPQVRFRASSGRVDLSFVSSIIFNFFFPFCIYLCARIFLDITSRGPSFRRGLFSPSFVFSIYRFFVRVLCHDVLGCISLCMSLIVYDLCVCVCGRGGRVRMICCFDFLFVSFLSPFFFFSLLLIYFVTSVPCLCCLVV